MPRFFNARGLYLVANHRSGCADSSHPSSSEHCQLWLNAYRANPILLQLERIDPGHFYTLAEFPLQALFPR